jgi:hypothetical protein
MKVYTLKDIETGLFYAGHRGRTKKPRLFRIGALKVSIQNNYRLFPAFKDLYYRQFRLFAETYGDEISILPEQYVLQEIEIPE